MRRNKKLSPRQWIKAFVCGATVLTTPAVSAVSNLTLAWEAPPRSIDPRYAIDADSQYLENLLHCSLITFDRDGRTIGDLAKSWTWKTSTTLEVKLEPKASFSDGRPVQAKDVKATYEFFGREDLKPPSPRKGAFTKIKAIEAPDNHTVIFTLKEPDSTFVTNLVVGVLPETFATKGLLGEKDKVQGCGPFVLSAMEVGSLVLVRNPHYSLGKPPKVDQVTIKIVGDETTRYAKLKAGEVDIVQNIISRDKLESIAKGDPSLLVYKRPGLNTTYLGFNMRDQVVGNKDVRRAIAHAIDREKIIKYLLKGLAIPATTLITPSDPFYNDNLKPIAYDPSKAKTILDKAGFKDPDGDGPKPRFKLTYKTTTSVTRVSIAKAVAADLREVGIDVKVVPLEWGRFKADVDEGKVQMWSLSWKGFKDPDIYRYAFATDSFPPKGGNRGWYSNKKLDKLLEQARRQTQKEERIATYAKVQNIVAEELPYVFLFHEEIFAVVNKKVHNFEIYADGRYASLKEAYKK